MEKKLVLVSQNKSFMVNAMIKNLSSEGYEVENIQPKVKAFADLEKTDQPKIVILYLEGIEGMLDFLIYLKDVLTEDEEAANVYFIGNEDEIEEAHKSMPDKLVSGVFKRPLNVKELVVSLNEIIETTDIAPKKRHILVVDDDGTMLRTLKLWLSDRYVVYMANSGMNAIQLLTKNKVDLILLDYEMPVASGPQVLEMIRNEPSTKNTPVMFLTAKNDKESIMKVMELKPEKYLLKTMPPDDLLANIEEFFEQQKNK